MTQKQAVIETLKHFAANTAVGVLNFMLGFGIALMIGAFIPVNIPIDSLTELIKFASVVGAGSGLVGSALAVESDGSHFKATRVLSFIRDNVYPPERNNGAKYNISSYCGLSIHRKKSWQDYIMYF